MSSVVLPTSNIAIVSLPGSRCKARFSGVGAGSELERALSGRGRLQHQHSAFLPERVQQVLSKLEVGIDGGADSRMFRASLFERL